MYVPESDVSAKAAEFLARAIANEKFSVGARWNPLPHQVPPPGDWYGWLLRAGRGAGKTDACAKYVVDHVNGPPCMNGPIPHWIGIIAPTLGDAATACFDGPSGIKAHDATAKMTGGPGGLTIKWDNGSQAKLFGASTPEDVERLRAGGNRCLAWLEELAAWRHLDDCWDHMRFGLRVGPRPHFVASTTPKPRQLIKALVKGDYENVVTTRASTNDNPHLETHIRDSLFERYGGTTLGAQELDADIVEQVDGAFWQRDNIDRDRISEVPDGLQRITVGVDPSGGAGEQGIVVVGKQEFRSIVDGRPKIEYHGYVLDDRSCNLSPDGWGRRAVQTAIDWEADDIVVETNYGGDMAVATIQGAANDLGVPIPVRKVTASRGKRVRAEPVSVLSNREKWHHVGRFEQLEDQLCTWTPELDWSPDRLDAMVWGAWHVKLVGTRQLHAVGKYGGSSMNAKIG